MYDIILLSKVGYRKAEGSEAKGIHAMQDLSGIFFGRIQPYIQVAGVARMSVHAYSIASYDKVFSFVLY